MISPLWISFSALVSVICALSIPSNPSINQLPSTNISIPPTINTTHLTLPLNWPPTPYATTYNGGSSLNALILTQYGRPVSHDLVRQTVYSLDAIITTVLQDADTYDTGIKFTSGFVTFVLIPHVAGLSNLKVAVMLQKLRDMIHFDYGPREIEEAEFGLAEPWTMWAKFALMFSKVR